MWDVQQCDVMMCAAPYVLCAMHAMLLCDAERERGIWGERDRFHVRTRLCVREKTSVVVETTVLCPFSFSTDAHVSLLLDPLLHATHSITSSRYHRRPHHLHPILSRSVFLPTRRSIHRSQDRRVATTEAVVPSNHNTAEHVRPSNTVPPS